MANRDAPMGFRPAYNLITGSFNGQTHSYRKTSGLAEIMLKGDLVQHDTDPGAETDSGMVGSGVEALRTIQLGAASTRAVGAVVGFRVDQGVASTVHPGCSLASVAALVYVADDPFIVFNVQEDGDTTPIAVTDVGNTRDPEITAGSVTTGNSGHELDSDDSGAGTIVLGLSPEEGNAVGAYANWLVLLNEHSFRADLTGS